MVESKATLFLQAKVVLVGYRAGTNRFLIISMQNILRLSSTFNLNFGEFPLATLGNKHNQGTNELHRVCIG